jgi:hypothetical protein
MTIDARVYWPDAEVSAMAVIVETLGPLDEATRRRVMRYLVSRYADGVLPAAGTKPRASDAPPAELVATLCKVLTQGGPCRRGYGHSGSHDPTGACPKCGERHITADREGYCPASS